MLARTYIYDGYPSASPTLAKVFGKYIDKKKVLGEYVAPMSHSTVIFFFTMLFDPFAQFPPYGLPQ